MFYDKLATEEVQVAAFSSRMLSSALADNPLAKYLHETEPPPGLGPKDVAPLLPHLAVLAATVSTQCLSDVPRASSRGLAAIGYALARMVGMSALPKAAEKEVPMLLPERVHDYLWQQLGKPQATSRTSASAASSRSKGKGKGKAAPAKGKGKAAPAKGKGGGGKGGKGGAEPQELAIVDPFAVDKPALALQPINVLAQFNDEGLSNMHLQAQHCLPSALSDALWRQDSQAAAIAGALFTAFLSLHFVSTFFMFVVVNHSFWFGRMLRGPSTRPRRRGPAALPRGHGSAATPSSVHAIR